MSAAKTMVFIHTLERMRGPFTLSPPYSHNQNRGCSFLVYDCLLMMELVLIESAYALQNIF
jgi:hypothetical protein